MASDRFSTVPELRSEHAAPLDVELARHRRGIREEVDDRDDEEAEREQDQEHAETTVSIEEQAVEAIADGGEILQSDGGRDVQDQRLLANEIACELIGIDDVQDFEPWCAVVRDVQESIVTEWAQAQAERRDREQESDQDQELLVAE